MGCNYIVPIDIVQISTSKTNENNQRIYNENYFFRIELLRNVEIIVILYMNIIYRYNRAFVLNIFFSNKFIVWHINSHISYTIQYIYLYRHYLNLFSFNLNKKTKLILYVGTYYDDLIVMKLNRNLSYLSICKVTRYFMSWLN